MNAKETISRPSTDSIQLTLIRVVVVEDHHHVLEHVHYVLRRRKELNRWKMVHFDAHPDLACSDKLSALSCFQPRFFETSLYDELDQTSSGIAEWILPLVLAGGLGRVHWIKPPESRQLPLGHYTFQVGAWNQSSSHHENDSNAPAATVKSFFDLEPTSLVRVDWFHPYYLDDDSAVPTDQLTLAQPLELIVSELSSCESESNTASANTQEGDWALDICLDYFACLNPYLTDLEEACPALAKVWVQVVTSTRWYRFATQNESVGEDHLPQPPSGMNGLEMKWYVRQVESFRRLVTQLLVPKNGCDNTDAILLQLLDLYESPDEARVLLESLLSYIVGDDASHEADKWAALVVESLSVMTLPHRHDSIKDSSMVEEQQQSLEESIALRLEAFEQHLQQRRNLESDPFIITIARSTLDGFTPANIVEDLQNSVLQTVHSIYCGCSRLCHDGSGVTPDSFLDQGSGEPCRLQVIFDYGKWAPSSFETQI